MLDFSNEEKELYQNANKELTLTFGDGTTLTNDDIYYESLSLEQVLCDEEALTFGKCVPSELNVKIFKIPKNHKGDTINLKIRAGEFERDYGTYRVVEDSLTDDKQFRNIKAYDRLYDVINVDVASWYNGLWRYDSNGNSIPIKMKDFRDSFFSHIGITQNDTDLANDNIMIEQTEIPTVLSAKDAMESICEINACFGRIEYDGTFTYAKMHTVGEALYPSDTLYPSDYVFPKDIASTKLTESSFKSGSLRYEDFSVKKITKVQIRMEEGDIGASYGVDGNTYVIEDNFLLYGKIQSELEQIALNFLSNTFFVEYNPLSVETQGKPWLQVGDFVKVVNGRDSLYFPILRRVLKGIQALTDELSADGVEVYTESANGIKNEVLKLKGKSNVLTRNLDETNSRITDLNTKVDNDYWTISQTQSAIKQTSDNINLSVENLQQQINGQVNTYYGTEIPTLNNYPANEWTTDEIRFTHNGDKYYVRDFEGNITSAYRFLLGDNGYAWETMADTDATQALQEALRAQAQVVELSSELDLTEKQIQATVGESISKWTTDYDISYNGFGHPNENAMLGETNPLNKYYMNQQNGKIYKCTAYNNKVATWQEVGNAQTTKDYTDSLIRQTANEIQSVVSKSTVEWDTSSYAISYSNYGSPSEFYTASATYSNKYYLNQQNGYLYLCEGSGNNWSWVYKTTLQSMTNKLDSRISQNATNISSKVSKDSIISEINQSAENVSIKASKINLNGVVTANQNFKILSDGSMEAKNANISGVVTSGSSSGNKVQLNNSGMNVYWNNAQLMDVGTTTMNGYRGVRFNGTSDAKFLALSVNNNAKLIINNGYTPDGYVDSMYILGGVQIQGHINLAYNNRLYFFSGRVGGNGSSVLSFGLGRVDGIDVIHTDGSIWAAKNLYYGGGVYAVSDKRKKHGIEYLQGEEIDNVFDSIEPCSFKLNDFEDEKTHFGFIAQDVEEAVNEAFDDDLSIIGGYGDGYKSLNYTEMIPLLWAEVKRLKKRIDELEKGGK